MSKRETTRWIGGLVSISSSKKSDRCDDLSFSCSTFTTPRLTPVVRPYLQTVISGKIYTFGL